MKDIITPFWQVPDDYLVNRESENWALLTIILLLVLIATIAAVGYMGAPEYLAWSFMVILLASNYFTRRSIQKFNSNKSNLD